MNTTPQSATLQRAERRALLPVVGAGLTAGAFDIVYACTVWGFRGVSPIRVGQSVAAGLLGREAAVAGGVWTGLLGFLLHFSMAIIMAGVYYAAATRLPLLVKRAIPCGIVYGLGLYIVMNYVVVPLSAIGPRSTSPPLSLVIPEVLVHMFLVGLTIALFTRRALRND